MATSRLIAVMMLLTIPAVAQPIPTPPTPPLGTTASNAPTLPTPPAIPATPQPTPAPAPTVTSAPMPDPLMAPDLQTPTARTPSLATLVTQTAWQDPVIAAARAQFKQLPQNCPAANFKPTGELVVYAPPAFASNGTLTAGIWSERVMVTGCGAPASLNILTVLQAGSAPTRIPTMPGDTHADPTTQKSALQYAQAVAARAADPNCKQLMFVNTKFDGYTGIPNTEIRDGRDNRAWREDWSLYSCGAHYSIELTFTPNAQGTQLVATNPVKRN